MAEPFIRMCPFKVSEHFFDVVAPLWTRVPNTTGPDRGMMIENGHQTMSKKRPHISDRRRVKNSGPVDEMQIIKETIMIDAFKKTGAGMLRLAMPFLTFIWHKMSL